MQISKEDSKKVVDKIAEKVYAASGKRAETDGTPHSEFFNDKRCEHH